MSVIFRPASTAQTASRITTWPSVALRGAKRISAKVLAASHWRWAKQVRMVDLYRSRLRWWARQAVTDIVPVSYISVFRDQGTIPPDALPRAIRNRVLGANWALKDWGQCPPEKAIALATLILWVKPRIVVELGVFGGRSLLPQAEALKHLGFGVIYGVEPWSNETAVETSTSSGIEGWWSNVDMVGAKSACLDAMLKFGLAGTVKILECGSKDAFSILPSGIDIIHIDVGHSGEQALADVAMAWHALAERGYIWLDHIAWPSLKSAVEFLEERCDVIGTYEQGDDAGYGLYRKRAPRDVTEAAS